MCPILKGWFASDFDSKGRVLPAALQSFAKAARHLSFWISVFSFSWVLSVCSCSPTQFYSMTTDPPENSHASNGIDAEITQIVKAQNRPRYQDTIPLG